MFLVGSTSLTRSPSAMRTDHEVSLRCCDRGWLGGLFDRNHFMRIGKMGIDSFTGHAPHGTPSDKLGIRFENLPFSSAISVTNIQPTYDRRRSAISFFQHGPCDRSLRVQAPSTHSKLFSQTSSPTLLVVSQSGTCAAPMLFLVRWMTRCPSVERHCYHNGSQASYTTLNLTTKRKRLLGML